MLFDEGEVRKAGVHRHFVVAVRVVGRDAPLVAPKEVHFGPVEGRGVGVVAQLGVELFGSRTSAEGYEKGAMVFDRFLTDEEEVLYAEGEGDCGVSGDDQIASIVPRGGSDFI